MSKRPPAHMMSEIQCKILWMKASAEWSHKIDRKIVSMSTSRLPFYQRKRWSAADTPVEAKHPVYVRPRAAGERCVSMLVSTGGLGPLAARPDGPLASLSFSAAI